MIYTKLQRPYLLPAWLNVWPLESFLFGAASRKLCKALYQGYGRPGLILFCGAEVAPWFFRAGPHNVLLLAAPPATIASV